MSVTPLPFKPEAVLFDMDGLMLDSERMLTGCLAQAGEEAGHVLPHSLWLAMVGNSNEACRVMLAEHVGPMAAEALFNRAHTLYMDVVEAGVPHKPGIVALLGWLHENAIPRAVGTTTKRPLALRKLAAAGLLPHFAAVCTSSDVAQPKPAPDIYLLAAQTLGVAPTRCVVLEDSPIGVRAALAAGMTPIQIPDLLVPDAPTRALGHRIVASLTEAQALLAAALSP
ncbi:MAG: HAD family phosphatase [Thermomonas sp.]|jgi:HAD superfamily hydrolase (TIGR01509 family)|uniref:HAD family hydrolase n=1 Tax=Thermomonas sp. TaxID=1971895 RepID=UPI001EC4AEA3|nr:HAD family phosphatase [Thermomonas sp.]MBV2208788.1 HAD family phosphatase [Thermomonas sp.]